MDGWMSLHLNFKPCHVAILEGSHVAVAISQNVEMLLVEFCSIIRTKTAMASPYTATGVTKMAENSVKGVANIVFYVFKYST